MAKKSRKERKLEREGVIEIDHALENQEVQGPEEENTQNKVNSDNGNAEPTKLFGLIAIIAGILVVISGYIVFNYFNQAPVDDMAELSQVEIEDDVNNNSEGIIAEGVSTIREEVSEPEPIIAQAEERVLGEESITIHSKNHETVSRWTPNDYKSGDITSDSTYTVKSGDTLWEIAEAVYGNGGDWHRIADANNVDYLSNGNPLIIPGQTLTFP